MIEETFIEQLLNNTRECLMHFPDKETAEGFIDELHQNLYSMIERAGGTGRIKGIGVGATRGNCGNGDQHPEVYNHDGEYEEGRHLKFFLAKNVKSLEKQNDGKKFGG